MKLELFQTTVKEYTRFTRQLPIDYTKAMSGDFSDSVYVAVQTRLMLLRKYTRNGRGNLYLVDVVSEAIKRFPEDLKYLSEFQRRFLQSCDQAINHTLADGTERTLAETIDDTMYGLHLHADKERIDRISQDSELLRLYCITVFVNGVETLVTEIFSFFEAKGVPCIEESSHKYAPAVHFEPNDSDQRNIANSPFWQNLVGSDLTEKNFADVTVRFFEQYTREEWCLWQTACDFTTLLSQEPFPYDEIRLLVFTPTIQDWGDFSEAIAYYKAIPSPGVSTTIRYNERHDTAYVYVLPHVEAGFTINRRQAISDIYVVTLVKDLETNNWKVFAFGGWIDPFIRG